MTRPQEVDVLRTLLTEGPLWIDFIKKDGSSRRMHCTLAAALLPPVVPVPEGTPVRVRPSPSPDLLVVYDLEQSGWRSFYANSVVAFSFTKETV